QANLDEARRQLARQQDLGKQGLVAKSTIDEAATRAESAEARFNAITARMNERLIRAPFSGLLGFREISPGTLLNPNVPITTLDDISVIKLDFTIPEIFMGSVRPGFNIIARSDTWKDREFEGVINSIGSRIDPVTRAVTVRALIDNEDGLLKPGMLMTVKAITDVRQALVIPESAFTQIGSDTYVFLAGEDGLAHRRSIRIGARRIGYVEVTDGLNAGDMVIIEGGFKLQDKSPYRLKDGSEYSLQLSGDKNRASGVIDSVAI
ncbi:MAG: efflux RND transporter periplasmic adaptor subunit, partial [Gammaproteobacteria bacterium]